MSAIEVSHKLFIIDPNATSHLHSMPEPPYPLSVEILPYLDKEYENFYNKYIINQQQSQYLPVSHSRSSGVLIPGGAEQLPVKSVKDYAVERTESTGDPVQVRVFTPTGDPPKGGWPIFLYMHGGGWVLGNINTENVHCSYWTERARCITVSVDYRLAPENPFPAAVYDVWETYMWVLKNARELGGNPDKIAAGGSSAGGNLTAVLSHMIIERNLGHLMFQVLIVPVTDNSADEKTYESWKRFGEVTPALPADKMMWYRHHYLPNKEDWTNPLASPIYAKESTIKQCPPAACFYAGLDVLRSEGEAYASKLRSFGIDVEEHVYPGVPHVVMAMNGVLSQGQKLVDDVCSSLHEAFYH